MICYFTEISGWCLLGESAWLSDWAFGMPSVSYDITLVSFDTLMIMVIPAWTLRSLSTAYLYIVSCYGNHICSSVCLLGVDFL